MFDDRLADQLRKDLDGPNLAAPHPTQARYRLKAPADRYPVGGMLRVGGAFVAGAIAAAALISAETGSTNPRIWTVRVESAFSRLTEPAAPTATPATRPTPPSGGEGSKGGDSPGGLPVVGANGQDHGASPSGGSEDGPPGVSPTHGGDEVSPAPFPAESPDDHGSNGSGGSPESMPTPEPTPEPEH
jgi:hypothetical protein